MTIGWARSLSESAQGSWAIHCDYRRLAFGLVCENNARQFATVSPDDFHLEDVGNAVIYLLEGCFVVPELRSFYIGFSGTKTNSLHVCGDGAFFRVRIAAHAIIDVSADKGEVVKPGQIGYSFSEWSLRQKVGESSREVFRVKPGELIHEPFKPDS